MDRCDFSSIMTCLKNHISESNQMNQPEFLYEVFEDFMDSPESKDFSFDNGLVCRWMTGQRRSVPKSALTMQDQASRKSWLKHCSIILYH